MQNSCANCGLSFEIPQRDLDFYALVSPEYNGIRCSIPPPTLCPQCRVQRRLSWRNDRTFYKRKCDLTGEEYVSIFAPNSPYKTYRPSAWYSDKWDPMDYGRDYDPNRSFFKQLNELLIDVPELGIDIVNCQNSEYCNYCGDDKNCYLDIAGEANEDSYFNLFIKYCKDCADCTFTYKSTLCYECIQCYNCYSCQHSMYLDNCSDCAFCFDLKGCKNCLLSTNLRDKEYYILNEPHSKEEYKKKAAELNLKCNSSLKEIYKIWNRMRLDNGIYRDMYTLNCENCIGNNIKNSKNCHGSFNATECEDSSYLYDVLNAKNCRDLNYSLYDPEVSYEICSTLHMQYSAFCYASHYCAKSFYCLMGNNSHDLFGCAGLNHKEFCILNKQYSQEEYEALVPQIIQRMSEDGEWGEFMPGSISVFSYNETVAQEYYPLTREEAESKGFKWRQMEEKPSAPATAQVPDCIDETDESITDAVLMCQTCNKNYRVIPQELRFYKKISVPVPPNCPDCRHKARFDLRNPRIMHKRKCDKCSKDIETTYSPERPEKVYCEECYLKEVY